MNQYFIFDKNISDFRLIIRSLKNNNLQSTNVLRVKLILNYLYDFKRFWRWYSGNEKSKSKTQLQAVITKNYHGIEKGLALKEPRVGFGEKKINTLISNLSKYIDKYGVDKITNIAFNVLFVYYEFNLTHGHKDENLYKIILQLKNKISGIKEDCRQGGVVEVTKHSILEKAQVNLPEFLESRYSIRDFAKDEVDLRLIEKAVKMAQKTPSVCNRQSSKVYVFSSKEDKQKVLSYQNGNRGFGYQASKVLIVVSDLEHFIAVGERNQCWIDGGMYAMSLIYALHSLGLGTCCLNWSVESNVDLALKRTTEIKDSESIIMMIAVGHLPNKLKIAQSPRKTVEQVLIVK